MNSRNRAGKSRSIVEQKHLFHVHSLLFTSSNAASLSVFYENNIDDFER